MGKARTHPNILRAVLGPYVQYWTCEALEQKLLSPFDFSLKNKHLEEKMKNDQVMAK